LYNVHAYVKNVLDKLLALTRCATSRFLALLLLILTSPDDRLTEDFQVAGFDGDTNDLRIYAVLVAGLE